MAYNYSPLQPSKDDFRLITILEPDPARPDLISCTIRHVSLASPPPYVALSYLWGDATRVRQIVLNGYTFGVTQHLYDALLSLREHGLLTVWADALSINQEDVDERGQQVLRMGAVYRRAERTVAWVGGSDQGDEGVIDLIERLAAENETYTAQSKKGYDWSLARGVPAERSPRQDLAQSDLEVLQKFFGHPYWFRVWIIQELALSREIVILSGEKQTTWEKVQEAVCYLPIDSPGTLHMEDLRTFREDARESKPIRLVEALLRSRMALASDAHDKIFALFGLTYDHSIYVSYPNYSTPIADLWQEMTVSALEWKGNLDAIIFLGNDSGDFKEPTWVPSWTSLRCEEDLYRYKLEYLSREKTIRSISNPLAQASIDWPFKPRTPPAKDRIYDSTLNSRAVFSVKGKLLSLRGKLVDHVNQVSWAEGDIRPHPHEFLKTDFTEEYCPSIVNMDILNYLVQNPNRRDENGVALFETLVSDEEIEIARQHPQSHLFSGPIFPGARPSRDNWIHMNANFSYKGYRLSTWLPIQHQIAQTIFRTYGTDRPPIVPALLQIEDRRLITTEQQRIGWADRHTRVGDQIWLLLGCSVPVILRKRAGGGYHLVGDSWIWGIMDGELMEEEEDGPGFESKWTDVDIY